VTYVPQDEPFPVAAGLGSSGGEPSLYQLIFECSPEAMALTRVRDNVMVGVNQEWLRLTGFPRERVIGHTAVEFGLWQDEAAREQALRPLTKGGQLCDVDVTLRTEDGAHRLMCISAVMVESQAESYYLFYLRDVTAMRMAQAAVHAGEQALEQANEKLNRQLHCTN